MRDKNICNEDIDPIDFVARKTVIETLDAWERPVALEEIQSAAIGLVSLYRDSKVVGEAKLMADAADDFCIQWALTRLVAEGRIIVTEPDVYALRKYMLDERGESHEEQDATGNDNGRTP